MPQCGHSTEQVISPEEDKLFREFKSYQAAQALAKYARETLIPRKNTLLQLIDRMERMGRSIKSYTERLESTGNFQENARYKKDAKYLLPPEENADIQALYDSADIQLLAKHPDLPENVRSVLAFGRHSNLHSDMVRCELELKDSIREYHRLHAELLDVRVKETQSIKNRFMADVPLDDKAWQQTSLYKTFCTQDQVISDLIDVNGTCNAAIEVKEKFLSVAETFHLEGDTYFQMMERNNKKIVINEIQKFVKAEIVEAQQQSSREEEASMRAASEKALEEASKLAAKQAEIVVSGVISVLGESSPKDLVSSALGDLEEKIKKSTIQMVEFDSDTQKKNLTKIVRVFNNVFAVDPQESKNIVESLHYEYLRFLYELNNEYYLAVKEKLSPLTPLETNQLRIVLSDLEKIEKERAAKAKKFLEQYHVKDVAFLTKILVPVYRAVFRFKKEHLNPIVKLALADKETRLLAQLAAAETKLALVKSSDEFFCEKSHASFTTLILGSRARLQNILSQQEDPAQHIDKILDIEEEIKMFILDPVTSVHLEMLTQQKMLILQQEWEILNF